MEKTVRDKIATWATAAWPVSSHVSAADVYRKAWGEWGGTGCSLPSFTEALQSLDFAAQQFGHVWIIRLPGPKVQTVKCEGVT